MPNFFFHQSGAFLEEMTQQINYFFQKTLEFLEETLS